MAKYISGEIIVGFYNDMAPAEAEEGILGLGLTVKNKIGSRNTYLVGVPVGSEQGWIEIFSKLPSVRFAVRNGIVITLEP